VLAFIAIFAAIAPSLFAQWPTHRQRGPRTASGEIDMNAPTPRTADGKPDFSGIWQTGRPGGGQRGGPPPAPGAAPAPPPPPPPHPPPAPPSDGGPPIATFGNAGQGFKEGLPFQQWAADLVKQRMADNSKDNPDAHCLPMGFLQFHNHPEPRKMIHTPDVLLIIYEANSGLRQIFTDGRSLPGKDAEPWWYGYSVGKWE